MSAQLYFHHKLQYTTNYQNDTFGGDDYFYFNNLPPWPYTKVKRSEKQCPVNNQYWGYADMLPTSASNLNKAPLANSLHHMYAHLAAPTNGDKDSSDQRNKIDEPVPDAGTRSIWNPAFPNNHRQILKSVEQIPPVAPYENRRLRAPVTAFWSPEKMARQPGSSSSAASAASVNMEAPGPSNSLNAAIDLTRDSREAPVSRNIDSKSITNGTPRPSSDPQGAVSAHVERQPGMIEDLTNKCKRSRKGVNKGSNGRAAAAINQAAHSASKSGSQNLKENIEMASEPTCEEGPGLSMPSVDELFGRPPPKPCTSNGRPKPQSPSTSRRREARPEPSARIGAVGSRKLIRKVKPWSNPSASGAVLDKRKIDGAPATISIPDEETMDEGPSTVSISDEGASNSASSIISIPDDGATDATPDSISISSGRALDGSSSTIPVRARRFSPPSSSSKDRESRIPMRKERTVNKVPVQSQVSTSKSDHSSPPSAVLHPKHMNPAPIVEPMDDQDLGNERVEEALAELELSEKPFGANTGDESELDAEPDALVPYRAPPTSPGLPKLCYARPEEVAKVPEQTRNFSICWNNIVNHMVVLSRCECNGDELICSHCSKTYTSLSRLKEHLGKVTKFMPYTCKLCGFKCVVQRRALRHLQEDHSAGQNEYRRR